MPQWSYNWLVMVSDPTRVSNATKTIHGVGNTEPHFGINACISVILVIFSEAAINKWRLTCTRDLPNNANHEISLHCSVAGWQEVSICRFA